MGYGERLSTHSDKVAEDESLCEAAHNKHWPVSREGKSGPSGSARMQGASPKLLLVEDNPDDEALMLRAIEKSNIKEEVMIVRDGVEAVQYLLEHEVGGSRSLPRAVFLDLKLPRLDGLEVLQRIRANPATRLLPVIILTTSGQEEDLLKSYVLGASSFVRKPLSYSELITVAGHLVTYWLTINQAPIAQA